MYCGKLSSKVQNRLQMLGSKDNGMVSLVQAQDHHLPTNSIANSTSPEPIPIPSQVIQIDLGLPPPRLDLRRRVRAEVGLEGARRRPAPLAGDEAPVVLEQEEAQGDLDLVGGEEAARAGVLAVAEQQERRRRRHELPAVLLPGLLAHA